MIHLNVQKNLNLKYLQVFQKIINVVFIDVFHVLNYIKYKFEINYIKKYYKNRKEYKGLIAFMYDKNGENKEGYGYYPMIVRLVNGRKKRWNTKKFIGGYTDLAYEL